MKVLNYGSLNVDYVYSVDHIIVGGETQHSSKLEVFSGGKGLNQSIALAKAGVPVYHAGIVGTDGDSRTSVPPFLLKKALLRVCAVYWSTFPLYSALYTSLKLMFFPEK